MLTFPFTFWKKATSGPVVSTRSLRLNGSGDAVKIAGSSILTSGDFSVFAWVSPSALGSIQGIFQNSSAANIQIRISGAGDITVSVDGSNVDSAGVTLVPSVFRHVGFSYASGAGTVKIYVDGLLKSTTTRTATYTPNDFSVLGSLYASGYVFGLTGNLDEQGVVGRVLTGTEFAALAANTVDASTLSNLLALYRFESTYNDSSGNGNTGTAQGSPTFSCFVPKKLAASPVSATYSLAFDGATNYASGTVAINGQTNLTVALWAKTASLTSSQKVVRWDPSSGSYGPYIGCGGAGTPVSQISTTNGDFTVVGTSTVLSGSLWNHFALTYDGSFLTLYVNGIAESTVAATGAIVSSSSFFLSFTSSGYNGSVAYPQVFVGKALSTCEVQQLMIATNPTGATNRYTLSEGSGTTAADAVGSSNLTLTGSPTWAADVPAGLQ